MIEDPDMVINTGLHYLEILGPSNGGMSGQNLGRCKISKISQKRAEENALILQVQKYSIETLVCFVREHGCRAASPGRDAVTLLVPLRSWFFFVCVLVI